MNHRPRCRGRAGYSCILFDIDNTLVDTDDLIRTTLTECGCQEADAIPVHDLRTLSPPKLLQRYDRQESTGSYWQLYLENACRFARLCDPETPDVLSQLREQGIKLGIVTSARKDVARTVLGSCGILSFFGTCLISYGSCRRRKPNPEPLLLAMEHLSTTPEETLYVGDAERDALASERAAVEFAFAGWASADVSDAPVRRAGIVLSQMSDLLAYIA